MPPDQIPSARNPTESCPHCGQPLTRVGAFSICPVHGQQSESRPIEPLRIFLSYGHDGNEELVRLIERDLAARGHHVWIDRSAIRSGDDWRRSITDGIVASSRVLSFLSAHATRDPGVCLDEIAIALGVKGGNIQTILVESEAEARPPTSISHIQWLDMHDWKARRAGGEEAWSTWYRAKLAEIVRVVESDESRRFAGEIDKLERHLAPISSEARMATLLGAGLVGREWLFDAIERWRNQLDSASRLFWITGEPGVGKSAFAAHLAHFGRDRVVAAQFVEWDKADHRDARRVVRSLAFQLATRLPDYRKLLLTLPEIGGLDTKDPAELFDYLLANPLRSAIHGGRSRQLVIVDALDEAGEGGFNPLADLLARHAPRLPDWIGLVVTSRPEAAVTTSLQGLDPFVLDTGTEANLADLRDYVRHELGSWLASRNDAESFVERILERSEGVFLYGESVCRDLRQGLFDPDRLDDLPRGIGGVFHQFFRRQFPDLDRYRTEVRAALRAILAAHGPLPLDVLQHLFGWEDEELGDFTRTLGSLFAVVRESEIAAIRPYHKSLRDWLADGTRSGPYAVSVVEGHRMLAEQLESWLELPDRLGDYARKSLPLHLAGREDWPAFMRSMGDAGSLGRLGWSLPDSLLQTALAAWPEPDRRPLEIVPAAFALCAAGISPRGAGFAYLHEDTIESVRRGGVSVLREDGTTMTLAEMEPDDGRLYAFIKACRRMLRCAFDFSEAVEGTGSRPWLAGFLEARSALKQELQDIDRNYDRTHFGPALRASETIFMWDGMLSGDGEQETHARSRF